MALTRSIPQSQRSWEIFILTKLLHSLEPMIVTDPDIMLFDNFYRATLNWIQHLPQNTASPAVYLLIGSLPVEGLLRLRILSFFMCIIHQSTSAEYAIVKRQLVMNDTSSHSWDIIVGNILHQYKLPSAFKLRDEPRKKRKWKRQTHMAVHSDWTKKLPDAGKKMSTLKYLDLVYCSRHLTALLQSPNHRSPICHHCRSEM